MDRLKTNVLNFSMPGLNSCLWNCRNLSCETETTTSAVSIKGSIMILKWTGLLAFSRAQWYRHALVVHCNGVSKPRFLYKVVWNFPLSSLWDTHADLCLFHLRRLKESWCISGIQGEPCENTFGSRLSLLYSRLFHVQTFCEPWLQHFAFQTISKLAFTNTWHQNL